MAGPCRGSSFLVVNLTGAVLDARPGGRPWAVRTLAAALLGSAALGFAVPTAAAERPDPRQAFRKGVEAFHADRYVAAAEALSLADPSRLRNPAWRTWLLGQALFYDGAFPRARQTFAALEKLRGLPSGFAEAARWRQADCLWMEGAHKEAAGRYARFASAPPANGPRDPEAPLVGDLAVARFRQAVAAEEGGDATQAQRLFGEVYRTFPSHPLATAAAGRLPTPSPTPDGQAAAETRAVEDHLKRAETLTKDRLWDQALAELAAIGADAPEPARIERDYQTGMTKFHMRRDYASAGELLLSVAPKLSGDKAASALFHGTRALSRADRDDEAIAGYAQVVAKFPGSRYAPEAQYLAGWLDYNRGRFKESLPALEATIAHFGRSAFADDAAWCVAFAHFELGAWNEASQALARYERLETKEMSPAEKQARVAYWRARIAEQAGKKEEGERGLKEVTARWPLSFYALSAEARLHRAGVAVTPPFGRAISVDTTTKSVRAKLPTSDKVARDPDILRADELSEVGLDTEAGWWLGAHEAALVKRLGREGVPALLERYRANGNFRRALRLAEVQDRGLLEAPPVGEGRAYWEAAFPRAYQPLVDRFAAGSGNPELYLYAIMKKESAFDPWDVSYADARGLLQMIPPTSSRVADELHVAFSPEMLFEPETNIRLGAHYIGALVKKFAGQIPLAAGAYNAGPKAMQRWVAQHGRHPMDEMVELIAFAQTREYVKRAVGIYAHYRYLYGPTPYELPLEVKTDVAASGPEY